MKKIITALILALTGCSESSRSVQADGVPHDEYNRVVALNYELQNDFLGRLEALELILPTPGPQGPEGSAGPMGAQGAKGDTGVVSVNDTNSVLSYSSLTQSLIFDSKALVRKAELSSCGSHQKMEYAILTDSFECRPIMLNKLAVTGLQSELDSKALAYDLSALISSLKVVAVSGSYNDLADKPVIPSLTSQLLNDSAYLTSNSSIDASKIEGSIATSSSGSNSIDFSSSNTVTVTGATGNTLMLSGMRKGGSYTVIIEDLTVRTYSISAAGCTTIKYISHIYPSSGVTIFSVLVSDTNACYVAFRTSL